VYQDRARNAGNVWKSGSAAVDVLSNAAACARDIRFLSPLNINTIFVTFFEAEADHSGCMRQLQDAGIYVIVDFSIPSGNEYDRGTDKVAFFSEASLSYWKKFVDGLHGFSNLLGFSVPISSSESLVAFALPILRSHVRDLKAHIRKSKYRDIPIGSGTLADDATLAAFEFMTCGERETAIDFFVVSDLQAYSGEYSVELVSKLRQWAVGLENASVPLVFSYGHLANSSQGFDEIQNIYSPPITEVFSGVYVDEYFAGGVVDEGIALLLSRLC
jgi:Glucanosyltransferase